MFEHRYLTIRVSPVEGGLEFAPDWGNACDGGCTDTCAGCSVTCKKNSLGGFLADPEEEMALVLDLRGVQALLKQVDAENAE
jgi:hypothetical protein